MTLNESSDAFSQQICNSVHGGVTEILSRIIVAWGDRLNVLCDRWILAAQRVKEHNNKLFIK